LNSPGSISFSTNKTSRRTGRRNLDGSVEAKRISNHQNQPIDEDEALKPTTAPRLISQASISSEPLAEQGGKLVGWWRRIIAKQ
jgi:hypothetical protein